MSQCRKTIDGVPTREHSKDVVTPQNPLGVAGWAVPVESDEGFVGNHMICLTYARASLLACQSLQGWCH